MSDLSPERLRARARDWCVANLNPFSEWTIDELSSAFTALVAEARRVQREVDALEARSRACSVLCLHDECKRAKVIVAAILAQKETP